MKLISLTLENFRAIKQLEFCPNGNNAAIYGRNSTGKTTIYNAYTWLLFGKSATGEKDFSPKTLDYTGAEKHHLQHKVEGVFLLDNGQRKILTRIMSEKHTKKRGTGDVVFEGNTTEYYIDKVPVKLKEYDAAVKAICDEEKLKILTMPDYFPSVLSWQKRREIMMEAVGELLSDDEIIDSRPELQPLKAHLEQDGVHYSIDQLMKVAKDTRRKQLKDLEDIPIRIDETTKSIVTVEHSESAVKTQIEKLQEAIDAAEQKLRETATPAAVTEAQTKVLELKAKLAETRIDWMADHVNTAAEDAAKMRSEISTHRIDLNRLQREYDSLKAEMNRLNTAREKTASDYEAVYREQWNGSDTCPTCGQPLPEDKVEEAKRKFNLDKSQCLEKLNQYGREHCSKEMIEALKLQLAEKEQLIEQKQAEITVCENQLKAYTAQAAEAPVFETSEEYKAIQAEIQTAEEAYHSSSQLNEEQNKQQKAHINSLKQQQSDLKQILFIINANQQHQERIAELEAQEQEVSDSLEQTEYKISLCEKFVTAKIELLTQKFNSHFENVRFKLFEQQINGGYTECCEVMIPCRQGNEQMLVPYSLANTGSKMNAGLEIIDTLSKYWGISLPVFIDNAESYTGLPDIDGQVIQLVVSAADPVLRIEVEDTPAVTQMNFFDSAVAGDNIGLDF